MSLDNAFNNKPCIQPKASQKEHPGSVLDTLREIQEINPQIETVFIDSDEDERGLIRKMPVSYQISTNKPTMIGNLTVQQSNQSPFMVREMSPSNLNPNLLKNANTIALEDQTDSSSKKFLLIPNNVLPLLAKATGPVSLNVPGIGALVIPKPSEIINNIPLKIDFQKPVTEKKVLEKPYDPLNDPKYKCWNYRRLIKRDLEGFTIRDRLGFFKAEQKRANSCAYVLNNIVAKLNESMKVFKKGLSSTSILTTNLTPVQQSNLNTLLSWKQHFNSKAESDGESPRRSQQRPNQKNFSSDESESELKQSKGKKIALVPSKVFSGRKRGRPRKSIIKPFENQNDNMHIFQTLKEFQYNMDGSKPTLVINQEQCDTLNLTELSMANNVVFPISGDANYSKSFKDTLKKFKVKCVLPKVLGQYLAGIRDLD